MTILELREKRAKAWEAAKAFLDSHRNTNGVLSAEDDAAYSRMEQDITDLAKRLPAWSVRRLWTPNSPSLWASPSPASP